MLHKWKKNHIRKYNRICIRQRNKLILYSTTYRIVLFILINKIICPKLLKQCKCSSFHLFSQVIFIQSLLLLLLPEYIPLFFFSLVSGAAGGIMGYAARAGSFVVEKMNIFSYTESVPNTSIAHKQPSFLERYLHVNRYYCLRPTPFHRGEACVPTVGTG